MEMPGVLTPGLLANRISKPRRGGRDAGVLENVATCVTPPGFRLPVGTYHLGLAPQAIACHASSVPNCVCRRVEMAVEKKASLAAKKSPGGFGETWVRRVVRDLGTKKCSCMNVCGFSRQMSLRSKRW
jgi:hypothetical protein